MTMMTAKLLFTPLFNIICIMRQNNINSASGASFKGTSPGELTLSNKIGGINN